MEGGDKLELLLGGPPFESDKELMFVVKRGEIESAEVEERVLGLSEEDPVEAKVELFAKELESLCVLGPGLGVRRFRYGSLPAVLRLTMFPGRSLDLVVGKGEERFFTGPVSKEFGLQPCALCLATSATSASLFVWAGFPAPP